MTVLASFSDLNSVHIKHKKTYFTCLFAIHSHALGTCASVTKGWLLYLQKYSTGQMQDQIFFAQTDEEVERLLMPTQGMS